MNTSDKLLVDFFCGNSRDSAGRTIEQILEFDENDIENYHDFIQWIFPTSEESSYNSNAPIISNNFKNILSSNNVATCNFCRTCRMFIDFIGFECKDDTIVAKEKATMFYDRPQHNLLRITRVLNSLNQLGKISCSQKLFLILENIYNKHTDKIPKESFVFWEQTQISRASKKDIFFTSKIKHETDSP
jgi:hypothetical protein